jgi:EAL domain-containing protein (putative c-di-GMP-specific phosphodiesterase class I)
LKRFPVDRLKIDRSFVQHIAWDSDDAVIVRAIIALGHNLGLRVLAEGVETEQQIEFLRANGCDELQGYYFSKPVSAWQMGKLLPKPPG